jgi:hypothetical protein
MTLRGTGAAALLALALADAAKAWEESRNGHVRGKIIL